MGTLPLFLSPLLLTEFVSKIMCVGFYCVFLGNCRVLSQISVLVLLPELEVCIYPAWRPSLAGGAVNMDQISHAAPFHYCVRAFHRAMEWRLRRATAAAPLVALFEQDVEAPR
jgi:hypothetical protein